MAGKMPKAKLPYSRTKVACGLCPYAGRTDALLRHARSKHDGNLFIKGSGFEPSGAFSKLLVSVIYVYLISVQAKVRFTSNIGPRD